MGRRRGAVLVTVLLALGMITGSGSAGDTGPRAPAALFFGDSLFTGTGAVPRQPVQARTAAALLGWRAVIDSYGGTGYTTGGRHGKPYLQRFQSDGYLRTQYDVIVLEGGTNDAHHGSLARLHGAALRTVDYLRARQPHARIVLVGAFAPTGVDLDRYASVDRILAGVARERGLDYVSQLHYSSVTDRAFLARDAFHPSTAGYTRMGEDLAAALRE